METASIVLTSVLGVFILFSIIFILKSFFTVQQNQVGVLLRFSKFKGVKNPGLNFKIPFIDSVITISLQNISAELKFQAITNDQANVYFNALVLYRTKDNSEDSIKKVAFNFISVESFKLALSRTIEGMVRSFIAGKKQSEILTLRQEIVKHVQEHILEQFDNWGYALLDVQINDIKFDDAIMESMAKVVASKNKLAAAENEGNAVMIQKTKEAEAIGNSIKISAEAERIAAESRGRGVASFRKAVTEGLKSSVQELGGNNEAVGLIAFSMWTEAIKQMAENGKGNFINLDGSPDGMTKTFKTLQSLSSGKSLIKES